MHQRLGVGALSVRGRRVIPLYCQASKGGWMSARGDGPGVLLGHCQMHDAGYAGCIEACWLHVCPASRIASHRIRTHISATRLP
jgi:hypothetical protein